MSQLAFADRDHIAAIYRESHALWGVGLSPADYFDLWDEISSTPWARQHARFFVWLDDRGDVLSSLKLYRPRVRVLDRTARCSILGAIFTPKRKRRQGHASALVGAVLERARAAGDPVAILYSDIGTTYYEGFGFKAIPAEEQWGRLPRLSEVDDSWQLRPMFESDRVWVERAHERSTRHRLLTLIRDPEHWGFLRLRSDSYFRRLGDPEVRHGTAIALHRGKFVGSLTTVEGRGEWNVREVAASDGDPATMAAILRLGAIRARHTGLDRCYAWLPPEVLAAGLGEWRLRIGPRRRAVPMILALDPELDLTPLGRAAAAFIPYQDQF